MSENLGFSRVCVFCGSNDGAQPEYVAAARELGCALAARGIETVYGGGRRGLMGALADSALQAGGKVIGIMPQSLVDMEIAHRGLTKLHIVRSMHERKALMNQLSDAFVILPGGWGTMDELCEMLTWSQLGIHDKPVAMCNIKNYYDAFLAFADHAMREGLLKQKDRDRLLVGQTIGGLLSSLESFVPSSDVIPVKVQD